MAENSRDEPAERLKRKRDFYDALDLCLDDEKDSIPDLGRQSSERALQNGSIRKKPKQYRHGSFKSISSSAHGHSAPGQTARTAPAGIAHSLSSPLRPTEEDVAPPSLRRAVSAVPDHIASHVAAKALPIKGGGKVGKNSTTKALNAVPEERQIFKGLHFYFFPNSDNHPARKIRIAKAQQYGATWVREWSQETTHVIMDKGMDFGLMLKWNKLEVVPSNVAVVSDIYPAECISNKALLDPTHIQFKVKGYNPKPAMEPPSSASDPSLELKPAKKDVMVRQEETPRQNRRTPSPLSTASTEADDGHSHSHLAAPVPTSQNGHDLTGVQSTAELDEAIQTAHDLRHIPLDDEDEETSSRPTTSSGSDGEGGTSGLELLGQKKNKFQRMQDKIQCMQKCTGEGQPSTNESTIAILQQMADYYGQIADEWRSRAYRKAITVLRNHRKKIQTKEEALALPQVGERLAAKIEEIAVTNRLRRLDNALAEPSDQILQTFMKVYGAGLAQATKWVKAGFKTLDELLEKADLTHNQRIGIEHFEDFNSRIPRAEVEQHGGMVRRELHKIDPTYEVIIGGSYRRGASTSGDIDCLITRPNTALPHIRAVVFQQLVPKLKAKGFLVADLAVSRYNDGTKWHGASTLPSLHDPPVWRRLDLLLVPSDELGAALIYWTGNDIFNRSLRLLASKKQMRLNQKGLYEGVTRGKGREKLNEGTLVEGRDEKRIFEILGVPWRPPEHRIC